MKNECIRCKSVDFVLRAILEQMSWNLADVADDKQFRSIRLKDKKDDRLNIIDYWSRHWQWSSSMFIRYDSDFGDDSAKLTA